MEKEGVNMDDLSILMFMVISLAISVIIIMTVSAIMCKKFPKVTNHIHSKIGHRRK